MPKPTPFPTLLETAIEKKKLYQGRLIERMVNIPYFTKKIAETKADTQERVDAKKDLEQGEKDLHDDQLLMEAFDELIKQLGGV